MDKLKLKEIASIQMGYAFRSRLELDNQGNVNVIQMKDIKGNGVIDLTELTRVNIPYIKEHHWVKDNDIILRSRGRTTTSAIVKNAFNILIVTAPLLVIRTNSNLILPAYLAWFINQPSSQIYLSSHARGSSVLMVSIEAVSLLEVILPSLGLQRKVVELSNLADKEQELLKLLAAKRQQYINRVLMQMTKKGIEGENNG